MSVQDLIASLEEFASRHFPVAEVHRFLQHNPLDAGELEPYIFFSPEQYTRNLLHKSEEFELLAICWDRDQAAPIHGHEGEKCWARVERGRLRFTNYREIPEGSGFRLEQLSCQDGGPGFLDGPADIHAVENRFRERAISLHVYSKPYQECDIYDAQAGTKERRRLSYFSKFGRKV